MAFVSIVFHRIQVLFTPPSLFYIFINNAVTFLPSILHVIATLLLPNKQPLHIPIGA